MFYYVYVTFFNYKYICFQINLRIKWRSSNPAASIWSYCCYIVAPSCVVGRVDKQQSRFVSHILLVVDFFKIIFHFKLKRSEKDTPNNMTAWWGWGCQKTRFSEPQGYYHLLYVSGRVAACVFAFVTSILCVGCCAVHSRALATL